MKKIAYLLALLLTLSGCNSGESKKEADFNKVAEKINDLERRASIAEARTSDLSSRLDDKNRSVELRSSSDGYQYLDTPIGVLLVALRDIKPVGSGTRVSLYVGNTTSATIVGMSGSLTWAVAGEERLRTKEFEFVETFKPGVWTSVRVTLDDTLPEQFKSMALHGPRLQSISMMDRD